MAVTLALAGDTMLGRGVAERILDGPDVRRFFSADVRALVAGADLFLLNLECCVSDRGHPWQAPGKPFFFRAPPQAADLLAALGVGCVTLANNHALDHGYDALADTCRHLARVGIRYVGAGPGEAAARCPALVTAGGLRFGIVGLSDHPADFAATPDRPGIAYARMSWSPLPRWVHEVLDGLRPLADLVVVTPHWGPNMVAEPRPQVRAAASALVEAGADLVAGHSAHVFHGVRPPVLYDLGDFIDDYAVDPYLRNDLGLLWLVTVDERGPVRLSAFPLTLDYAFTRFADGADRLRIRDRFTAACAAMGTPVHDDGDSLTVDL
ncbi:poly-gamma-glutamate synthesis protein (capsule biosynthesis protein) [Nonomuraea maritima]|uniref:Poly-gamma-glutamate synthesis protein (Capsule biosynthesis protein) n=1 Tax=Nonomuraea maritima TaxID=683260 RepID=A0A1G9N0Z9_9ACTN|nr:CapA family protein [Nonomuraea maritima]SDL80168.1 poly-gamma-glutamate synthesis protein (capsule biosynthesis protein) [Nonomuraea maritima]